MSANPHTHPPTALLTGHNGFLGNYLAQGLEDAGFGVLRLGRTAGDIVCDLAVQQPDLSGKPIDVVIHAAGKAHCLPRNEAERQAFFQVNREGTVRLLRALETLKTRPASFVLMSTVAVYGCETGENIAEEAPLAGQSPYAESKLQAEQVVQNWGRQQGVPVAILRLPLVVGNKAPGNLGTLVEAIRRGRYVHIGSGAARRSMVLAGDVARIVPKAAEVGGIYNLTDGIHWSVRELGDAIARQIGRRSIPTVPLRIARVMAGLGDGINSLIGRRFPFDSIALAKLTGSLTFSDQKARRQLGWSPQPVSSFYDADQALRGLALLTQTVS